MSREARVAGVATLAIAVLAVLLARVVAHAALGDVPHVQDEQAYLFQAKTLALGHLQEGVALPRAAFNMWFVDDRVARFGIFPPGWPAVLALFLKAGLTCWANPLLHGAATLVVAAAARRASGPLAMVLAACVYGLSPQALLLAASLMSHALVALLAAVVLLVSVEWMHGVRSLSKLALAGLAVGLAATTRPLCACVIGAGFLAVCAFPRPRWPEAIAFLLPAAALLFLLLAYNHALTDDALLFPQTSYFDGHLPPDDKPFFHYHAGCNALGFGETHGCDYGIPNAAHDLTNALSNTADNLTAWALLAGGGPLVFVLAALGMPRGRSILALPIVAVIVLYALYWYAGTCYGARFYHAALPALLLLAALGLARIRRRVVLLGTVAVWLSLSAFSFARSVAELPGYWSTDTRFADLARDWHRERALVMVAFSPEPAAIRPLWWTTHLVKEGVWWNGQRAGAALAENAADLDGPVVFARFHPALVPALRAGFPGRAMWLYVMHADARDDRVAPYEASSALGADEAAPADNFDGWVVPSAGQ